MSGKDTASAFCLGEVGNQGTAVTPRHALIAKASVRLVGLGGRTNRHAEALNHD